MAVDVGSAVGYLDLDISGFLAGLKTAQSEANMVSKNMATQIGEGFTSVGNKLSSVGSTLTKNVTVPLVAVGAAGLKVATDFEKGMSEVKAISGATGEEFDSLKEKAIELGASTAFSANEVAAAMTEMAKAGWNSQQIIDGMGGVLDAAAASGESLATVSTIVADTITGFGLEAKESTRIADLLTQAANSGTIGITDLGESFKYIAPVAGAMGISIEDATTAISAMSMAGIKGSQAGTSLRTMLTRMVKPTDAVETAMNNLGIVLTNSDGTFKSLDTIIAEMRGTFNGLTDEQKTYYATVLAGQEGMSGLLSLLNLTQEEYDAIAESMDNAGGVAQKTASIMQDNLASKTEQLMGSLESLAIKLADIVIPYLRDFVEWLTGLIEKFTALDPETQKSILKFAAFAAALGPVLSIVGKFTSGIGNMITTFSKLPGVFTTVTNGLKNVSEGFTLAKAGFSGLAAQAGGLGTKLGIVAAGITGPMLAAAAAIVAAIALVIAAFVSLWKNNQEFREKILGIWNQIKETFNKLCQGIVDRLNKLGFDFENIGEVLKAIWDGFCNVLAPTFQFAFQAVADIFDFIVNTILNTLDFLISVFTGDWEGAWNAIKSQFENVWNLISDLFNNWWSNFKQYWDTILSWFGTSWSECWNDIKTFFVTTWTNIIDGVSQWSTNMWNKAVETGSNFLNAIVEFFSQLPYNIGNFIGTAAGTVASWSVNMWNKAVETGTNFINAIVEFFTQLPQRISEFTTNAYQNVSSWAINMWNKALEAGSNFLNATVSFFSQLPGKIASFTNDVYSKVSTWAVNLAAKAKEAATNLFNNIVNGIKTLPTKVTEIGKNLVQGLWNGITSAGNWLKDKINSFSNGIIEGFKSAFNIHSPSKETEALGEFITQGLGVGMENEEGGLLAIIQNIFDDVLNKLTSIVSSIQNLFAGGLFSDEETSALDSYNSTLLTTLSIYRMLSDQMRLCVEYAKSLVVTDNGLLKIGSNQNGMSSLSNFNNTDIETLKDLILSVLGKGSPDDRGSGEGNNKPDQLVIPITIGEEQIETVVVDLLRREVRT